MSQYRRLFVCLLFCGGTLHSFAEVESQAKNYSGPYRPWSLEFQQVNPEDLYDIDAVGLAEMPLENPLLKYAYMDVFLRAVGHLDQSETAQILVIADMRRRGEAITPMLIKLLEENQETRFENTLFGNIDNLGTVKLDPYLEYARNLLRTRTVTMSASVAGSAAALLSRHGSKDDVELLRSVMEKRPYVADSVTRKLDALVRRLEEPESQTRPDLKERPKAGGSNVNKNESEVKLVFSDTGNGELTSKMWIVWILLIVVMLSTLVLLLRAGIKQRKLAQITKD